MKNTYALDHARRLHAHGFSRDDIHDFLRRMTTRRERAEILDALAVREAA